MTIGTGASVTARRRRSSLRARSAAAVAAGRRRHAGHPRPPRPRSSGPEIVNTHGYRARPANSELVNQSPRAPCHADPTEQGLGRKNTAGTSPPDRPGRPGRLDHAGHESLRRAGAKTKPRQSSSSDIDAAEIRHRRGPGDVLPAPSGRTRTARRRASRSAATNRHENLGQPETAGHVDQQHRRRRAPR